MGKLVRKQMYLTAEQDEWLAKAAVQEGRPAAEIVRAALDARMGLSRPPKARVAKDSLWKIVGLGASDHADVSEQVDHYLYGARKR